jgi:EAL domain-containing protein (putative c-di-GMP-specific phosphodiesterase class I)
LLARRGVHRGQEAGIPGRAKGPLPFCRSVNLRPSCTFCGVRERCTQSNLQILPATADLGEILASVLHENNIAFEWDLNLFSIRRPQSHAQVIGLLREVLTETQREGLRVLSGTTGQLSAVHLLDDWWSKFENAWFGRALAENQFVTWFQPIVEVAEVSASSLDFPERIFAHECLIRLCDGRVYNGSEIVEAACARNEMRAFDSYARRLAIRSAARQSPAGLYFINFMPSSIYNPSLCMRSSIDAAEESGMRPANIVFEVVESDLDQNLDHLREICNYCRNQGFGFALDDVGRTGTNSLEMVADLRPDYIKLDKSLIQNVAHMMYLPAIIRKLVDLAGRLGVTVIAEGVESRRAADSLLLLGVRHMQGYFFGRPAPQICTVSQAAGQEPVVTRTQPLPA